jgi:hypothetical protein
LIKILIVNEHAVVRERVKRIFDKQLDETTFGEAGYITKDSLLRKLVELIKAIPLYGCEQKPAR